MKNPKAIRLSRRDFLKSSGTAALGFVLAACGFTPTPTATPTAMPTLTLTNAPLPSNTRAPTLTPTLTRVHSLTPSQTASATNTETPAPTLTVTPTKLPSPREVLFDGDFENGFKITGYPGWNNSHTHGGNARVEASPDGGHDLLNYIDGAPVKLGEGTFEYRIGPDWYNKGGYLNTLAIAPPCSVSCDVNVSMELMAAIRDFDAAGYPTYLNLLSFHTNRVSNGKEVKTNQGFAEGFVLLPNGTLNINYHYGDLGGADHYSTDARLTPGVTTNLMLYIDDFGRVLPFVDHKMAVHSLDDANTTRLLCFDILQVNRHTMAITCCLANN